MKGSVTNRLWYLQHGGLYPPPWVLHLTKSWRGAPVALEVVEVSKWGLQVAHLPHLPHLPHLRLPYPKWKPYAPWHIIFVYILNRHAFESLYSAVLSERAFKVGKPKGPAPKKLVLKIWSQDMVASQKKKDWQKRLLAGFCLSAH